jgi:two-component sensor histidine kinase/CHASE3 domain sensor protein
MPISTRFVVNSTILLLSIGFLVLFGIVGMTVWLGERARLYSEEAGRLRDSRAFAVELRSAMQSAESSQRGFLIGGNEIYLAPYDTAKTQVNAQFARIQQVLTGANLDTLLDRLSGIIKEKIDEMDRTIALKASSKNDEALATFGSNRGKALMDEANVFLSSIIRTQDERLTVGIAEQRNNATWLRLVSTAGGLVIVLVVAGVMITLFRYTRELSQARDEVQRVNSTLENRVNERTAALVQARDRAETLLDEVNHRVANSLGLVASLVRLQSNSVSDPSARQALNVTEARIHAISSVHKRLYTSGNTTVVDLDEYLSSLLQNVETSMRNEGHGASLRYELEPVKLPTDSSVNLGVIVTEWVTNAFKYAYPDGAGEVRVKLKRLADGQGELVVEDDGVGRAPGPAKGSGLGTRIVSAMARTIGAEINYIARHPGTGARLAFPSAAES